MIRTLFSFDPLVRVLPKVAPLSLFFGCLQTLVFRKSAGLLDSLADQDMDLFFARFTVFGGIVPAVALALAWGMPLHRATEGTLALPIRARDILLARLLAAYVLIVTCTVASLVPAVVWLRDLGELSPLFGVAWNLAAALIAGVTLVQSIAPEENRVTLRPAVFGAALAGAAAVAGAVMIESPVYGAVALAAAGALFARLATRAPASLVLVGKERGRRVAGRRGRGRRGLGWVLLRHSVLFFPVTVSMAAVAFYCAVQNNMRGMGPANLMMPLFFTFTIPQLTLLTLRKLDPLPVSRWRVLPYIVLPSLTALLLGTALSYSFGFMSAPTEPAVRFEYRRIESLSHTPPPSPGRTTRLRPGYVNLAYQYDVMVPGSHWRVAWNGEPPLIEGPDGETHRPLPHPLFFGVTAALYNPYSVGRDSSLAFIQHQLARAVRDVYGVEMSAEDLGRRYLKVGARGDVRPADKDLNLEKLHPQLHYARGGPSLHFLVLVIGWIAVTAISLRRNLPPRDRAQFKRWLTRDILGATLLASLFFAPLAVGFSDRTLVQAVDEALRFHLNRLTAGAPGLVAAVLVPVGYVWLGLRLRRMETPLTPIKNPLAEKAFRAA